MYASVDDMVRRFGEVEMIRLTTPDGQDAETVQRDPAERALIDASGVIDGYLRKRYQVPMEIAPQEVQRAACMLARYDLQLGEQKNPSQQAKDERDSVMRWLRDISEGKVLLDLAEVSPGDDSFAQYADRPTVFGRC